MPCLLKIQSMEPLFPEKSLVVVEPSLSAHDGDYIVIISTNKETIIRQLLIISDEKFITPLNPKFGKIRALSEKDKVLGTVVEPFTITRFCREKEANIGGQYARKSENLDLWSY